MVLSKKGRFKVTYKPCHDDQVKFNVTEPPFGNTEPSSLPLPSYPIAV